MKRQYTEMITSLRRAHKRTKVSYDDLYERGLKMLESADNSALRTAALGIEMLYETSAEVGHIFMPERAFCNWLSECARTLDPELADKAAEGFGSSLVCMHFPSDAGLPSVLVKIGTGENKGTLVLDMSLNSAVGGAVLHTQLLGQSAAQEMRVQYNPDSDTSIDVTQKQADLGEYYTRMIAGLGLYMGAFPEQVKEGIPADAKHTERIAGPSRTVGVSPQIIVREGVTPHYRVGHFRLLTANRYVNKRGHVVFVHGCFVRGHAMTVLSAEEAGE